MKDGYRNFGYGMVLGACLHATHEPVVPLWKRNDHCPEEPAARAVDLGSTLILAARTTTPVTQTFGSGLW